MTSFEFGPRSNAMAPLTRASSIALALSGMLLASSAAVAADGIRIAAVYENTSDAFWGSYMCGAKAQASKLGITLEVTSQATADGAKLAAALDTALLTEPNAVIVNPIDPAPWTTKIASLMQS